MRNHPDRVPILEPAVLGSKLFFRRPVDPTQTGGTPAGTPSSSSSASKRATEDKFVSDGGSKASSSSSSPKRTGSWMGSLVGQLGRLQKAAAGAVLGAVALTAVTTGAALADEPVEAHLTPEVAVVQTVESVAPPVYVVSKGDTMWGIAQRHRLGLDALVSLNPQITNPAQIEPGDVVRLQRSAPSTVKVRPGDSMWRIARRNGVDPQALIAANPQVSKPDLIQPGQVLVLPKTTAKVEAPVAPNLGSTAQTVRTPPVTPTMPSEPPPPRVGAAPTVDAPSEASVEVSPSESSPAEVVAEAKPDKPGALGKLWSKVRKLAFELLEDQKIEQEKTFELGENFTVGASIDALVLDSPRGDWQRMAFERAQPKGQDVLWLSAKGGAFVSGKRDGERLDANAELAFDYSMVRPHVFDEENPDPLAIAKDFVQNAYQLPFGHEAAARLAQGSRFSLEADLDLDAKGVLSWGTVSADGGADLELDVHRQSDDDVEVTYRRGANLDGALQAKELRDGKLEVGLGFELGRALEHRYRLDLSTPDGQRAYDSLLSLRGGDLTALADKADNGVDLVREDDVTDRGVDARVRHQGEDGLDVTATAGWSQEKDGDEVSSRLTGGLDAAISPDEADWKARLALDATRLKDEHETTTRAGAGLTVDKEISEDTDLKLTARVERGHEVDERWEQETRSGRLAHGGVLSTKLQSAEGVPIELGFDAKIDVRFELVTPLGEDGVVPLTGRQMQRAKEGTRLTLTGTGSVGFDAERKHEGLDLALDATLEGELEIEARRLSGDEVRVTVDLEREAEVEATAGYSHTTEGDATYSLALGHEVERDADKSASFTLSLSKPSHREAYAALLKGNMGPAVRVLEMEAPAWVKSNSQVQTLKLDAGPTEWLQAGLQIARRDLDPKDARIRWDSDRKAFTDAALAQGQQVRWIEAEGAFAPKVTYRGSAPVGGAISWRHGFSAGKTLRYRAFAPSVDGAAPELSPAFSAAEALAMPRGAEFELMGRGSLSGFTGVGFGTEWGGTGFTASASASADTTHEAGRTWEIEVQRLDEDVVEVSYERGSDRENAFEIAARAGVKVDSEELLGLESAIEQLALLSKATDALDDELEKRLMLELEASWSKKKADSTRITFEVDLSKPRAHAAYEGLVRLDASEAMALAKAGDEAVKITRGRQSESVERQQHAHLDVFGERLFLTDALRRDETTIEHWDAGRKRTDRSTYREQSENLIGRERDVRWDAVRVRTNDDPVGKGYYRLQYSDEDPLTSKTEVRRLVSLGKDLAAEPVRPVKIEKGARGLKKLFGNWARHGSTELNMDIFFTAKGIDGIRAHSGAQALQRYGEVAARRDGRGAYGWAVPKTRAKAIELLEEYFGVEDDHLLDSRDKQDEERSLEVAYWRLTGNEMWEDRDEYKSARAFAGMVGRMNASKDPAAWNRAFADMGEAMGFDFYDALSTMQSMAGKEEILVHQMHMKGRAVDIEMKDEGLLRYPS